MLSPKSKRPSRYCASFLIEGRARWNNIFFTLEGMSWHSSHHWAIRSFAEVERPWISIEFIFYPLTCNCLTNKSRAVVTSLSLGSISIISFMLHLVGRKDVQEPCRRNSDTGLRIYRPLRQDSKGILWVLPAECRLLLVYLRDRVGKWNFPDQ